MNNPQEEKRPFDDMATELLNFIVNPLETFSSKEAEHVYRLQRTRTFLEMKFGHVEGLKKEVEALRQWKTSMQPIISAWSERQDLAKRHPFSRLEEEG